MRTASSNTSETMESTEKPMQSRSHINNTYFYAGDQDPYLVQPSTANAHFAAVKHAIISDRPMQPEMNNVNQSGCISILTKVLILPTGTKRHHQYVTSALLYKNQRKRQSSGMKLPIPTKHNHQFVKSALLYLDYSISCEV